MSPKITSLSAIGGREEEVDDEGKSFRENGRDIEKVYCYTS